MTGTFGVLPYGRQTIDDDDVAAVTAALRDDFLTTGPKVAEFEAAFSGATGAAHAVACNNGTAALHLAALALGLGPDDAAIVPSLTFLATANIVRMTGAEVVFCDVDPDTGLLTPETLARAIEGATSYKLKLRAALPVHLNGQICDMEGIATIARKNGLSLIEDACHALGVEAIGACRHSAAACFSMHPVKAITTAEGGVVTTPDADMARRMRRLRSHGMLRDSGEFQNDRLAFDGSAANPWYYEMHEIGWNYRLPDLLCALGISQLRKLPAFFTRRKAIAAYYDRVLASLAPLVRPVPHVGRAHGWHIYALLVDFSALGTTRAGFMGMLREKGCGSQVHYIPVHQQPYYQNRYGSRSLPGTVSYYERCLSIPIYPALTDSDVSRVADAVTNCVLQCSRG